MEKRVLVTVRGLVQGVGFRMFVERSASSMGLNGWVRNLPDGGVEIDAQGPPGLVAELLEAMRTGPPASKVSAVSVRELEPEFGRTGFSVVL